MANLGQTMLRFCGALVLAAGATLVDHPRLWQPPRSAPTRMVPVVVAIKDIPEGMVISRDGLTVAMWPRGTEPAGRYVTVDSVVGRVTRIPIYKGEAIVPGRLAPVGVGQDLELRTTPGKRAYAIRINDVASVAGMGRPNSRVDVMVVIDDPNRSGARVAKLFMSDMRLLAIGAVVQRNADGRPISGGVATLEVTPEEAEALAIAASRASLQLVPRGSGQRARFDSLTQHE